MKKITVLFGNYGSGKTELSLNMALAAKQTLDDVTLVDLDIVNPYFRSSEHRAMLESSGIRVIAPVYANTGMDMPALPPDIASAFLSDCAVFDCGGDAVGGGLGRNRFDPVGRSGIELPVLRRSTDAQQNLGTSCPARRGASLPTGRHHGGAARCGDLSLWTGLDQLGRLGSIGGLSRLHVLRHHRRQRPRLPHRRVERRQPPERRLDRRRHRHSDRRRLLTGSRQSHDAGLVGSMQYRKRTVVVPKLFSHDLIFDSE